MPHNICMRKIILIHAVKNCCLLRQAIVSRSQTVTLASLVKLLAAENDLRTRTASHVTWPRGTGIYGKGQNLFRRLTKLVSYKQNY